MVIVATEHENTVRLYAHAPNNGGTHQTGQFTTNRTIDPHELAVMAVDMSAAFGWMDAIPTTTTNVRAISQPEARALTAVPDAITVTDERAVGTQKVLCPYPGCETVVTRTNVQRHLMNVHQLPKAKARPMVHGLKRVEVGGAPSPVRTSRKGTPQRPTRINRQGKRGAKILDEEILPPIVEWMRSLGGGTVGSAELAAHSKVASEVANRWLKRLAVQGLITEIPTPKGLPNKFAVAVNGATQEHTPRIAQPNPSVYDAGSQQPTP